MSTSDTTPVSTPSSSSPPSPVSGFDPGAGTSASAAQKTKSAATPALLELSLTPTVASSSVATIQATEVKFVCLQRSGGVISKMGISKEQEKLDENWAVVRTELIRQAREERPEWMEGLSDHEVAVEIFFQTGLVTMEKKSDPSSTISFVFKTREDEETQKAAISLRTIEATLKQLGAVGTDMTSTAHTMGMVGASMGSGLNYFSDSQITHYKPDKTKQGYGESILPKKTFWQWIARKPVTIVSRIARQKRELDDLHRLLESLKAKVGKRVEKALEHATSKPPLKGRALERAQKQIAALQKYQHHLGAVDEFAVGWALEHPFHDPIEKSMDERIEAAKEHVGHQVKALARHLGYDPVKYGRNAQEHHALELYFRNITLLGISDQNLHAQICEELKMREPECSLERCVLLSMQAKIPHPAPLPGKGSIEENAHRMRERFASFFALDPKDAASIERCFTEFCTPISKQGGFKIVATEAPDAEGTTSSIDGMEEEDAAGTSSGPVVAPAPLPAEFPDVASLVEQPLAASSPAAPLPEFDPALPRSLIDGFSDDGTIDPIFGKTP